MIITKERIPNLSVLYREHQSYLDLLRKGTVFFIREEYDNAITCLSDGLEYAKSRALPWTWVAEMLAISFVVQGKYSEGLSLCHQVLKSDPLAISPRHYLAKYFHNLEEPNVISMDKSSKIQFLGPKSLFLRKTFSYEEVNGVLNQDISPLMKCSIALSMKYRAENPSEWFKDFYKSNKAVIWATMEKSHSFAIDAGLHFNIPFSFDEYFHFCKILVKHDPYSIDTINALDRLHDTILEDHFGIKAIDENYMALIPVVIDWLRIIFPEDTELEALSDLTNLKICS